MTRPTAIALLLAMIFVSAIGCGKKGKSKTKPAAGVLTYNGKPMEGLTVTFTPKEGQTEGRPGWGVTDAEGKFTIRTSGENGAVPGTHVVTITPGPDYIEPMPSAPVEGEEGGEGEGPAEEASKPPFPPRYSDSEKSGFEAVVGSGQKEFEFNMTDEPAESDTTGQK